MKSRIRRILIQCGIGSDLKGYTYLVDAIYMEILEKKKSDLPAQLMNIYADIGKIYGVRPSNVERCIRHAISTAFLKYPPKLQDLFCGMIGPDGKVYNNRFINRIADHVMGSVEYNKTPEEMLKEGWCDDCTGDFYHCKLEKECAGYGGKNEKTV